MLYSGQSVRVSSAQMESRHGKEATLRVARQGRWARDRGNEQEIQFRDAVLADLGRKGSCHCGRLRSGRFWREIVNRRHCCQCGGKRWRRSNIENAATALAMFSSFQ